MNDVLLFFNSYTEEPFAAIGVTYPEGSTCTCTNGTKTLTAKSTSGQWVFAIPEAGTWTVTATNGTNNKSQSKKITTEGQFETVQLNYRRNLYTNGTENVAWTARDSYGIALIEKEAGKFCFYTDEAVTADNAQVYTTSPVDLSGYSQLYIKGNSLLSGELHFGVHSTNPAGDSQSEDAVRKLTVDCAEGKFERTLDISDLTGNFYINIGASFYYPEVGDHFYVTEVWAE